jgi:hypothetical protein
MGLKSFLEMVWFFPEENFLLMLLVPQDLKDQQEQQDLKDQQEQLVLKDQLAPLDLKDQLELQVLRGQQHGPVDQHDC